MQHNFTVHVQVKVINNYAICFCMRGKRDLTYGKKNTRYKFEEHST